MQPLLVTRLLHITRPSTLPGFAKNASAVRENAVRSDQPGSQPQAKPTSAMKQTSSRRLFPEISKTSSNLPTSPTGEAAKLSVVLHADLEGRPYRLEDFRDPLKQVGVLPDVAGLGAYQMSHVWLLKLGTPEAKAKLLQAGSLQVKRKACLPVDPKRSELRVKLHWVSFDAPEYSRGHGGTTTDASMNPFLLLAQVTLWTALDCASRCNAPSKFAAFITEQDHVETEVGCGLMTHPPFQASTTAPSSTGHIAMHGLQGFRGHGGTTTDASMNPFLLHAQAGADIDVSPLPSHGAYSPRLPGSPVHGVSCLRTRNRDCVKTYARAASSKVTEESTELLLDEDEAERAATPATPTASGAAAPEGLAEPSDVNAAPCLGRLAGLSLRTFRLSERGGLGTRQPARATLPQGSVLSPLLFNIAIAGLPAALPNSRIPIGIAMFADDLCIWRLWRPRSMNIS
ncbi:hypothetical protein ISCGN_016960 [Ixodes scapularis]